MRHRIHSIQWYNKRFVECAYNSAVKHLALPSKYDHFIFADHDIRPNDKTRPFLEADGEWVACEYPLSCNDTWEDPQCMHCGLWRCSTPRSPPGVDGWLRDLASGSPDRQTASSGQVGEPTFVETDTFLATF